MPGYRKLASFNLTDPEIKSLSIQVLEEGPATASRISDFIFELTGKSITSHKIGHIVSSMTSSVEQFKEGHWTRTAWTYRLKVRFRDGEKTEEG